MPASETERVLNVSLFPPEFGMFARHTKDVHGGDINLFVRNVRRSQFMHLRQYQKHYGACKRNIHPIIFLERVKQLLTQ